jgi:hypothetical protein
MVLGWPNILEVKMKSRFILAAICAFFLTTSMSFGYKATFIPKISVNGEYTDNIFLTEQENLKDHDYITTITPGFTADILGKNSGAKISYDASYTMYDNYDEFNGWRHKVNLDGWSQIAKKNRLNIRDNFIYTEDPNRSEDIAKERTQNPELPIDSTVRKSRQKYYTNFVSVNLNNQFGENNSFRVGYNHHLLRNDDPTIENNQYHNPSAGLTYWFESPWGIEVNGHYTRGEFEFSESVDLFGGDVSLLRAFGKHFIGHIRYTHLVVNYTGGENDDQTYNPSIGFKYDIKKDISLLFDAGYFHNDFKQREDLDAFNGSLRLIKEFEHGQINLSALGGFDYSFFGAEQLGFSQFYEGAASGNYQLAKFIGGYIYGSYRNTDYKDQADRKDKRTTVGAGLYWQAFEWMNIGLGYRFQTLDSTIETDNYDENRINVTITLIPTVPFHTSRY